MSTIWALFSLSWGITDSASVADQQVTATRGLMPQVIKAKTKTEDGVPYPAAAFAYVPDPEMPSTWKLRLWDSLDEKVTRRQVGMALAALGPAGFRGNRVQIPAVDMPKVKAKVRAAWRSVHEPGDSLPAVLRDRRMSKRELTADEERKMQEHAAHHSPEHMRLMRELMTAGMPFEVAHRAAMSRVGKAIGLKVGDWVQYTVPKPPEPPTRATGKVLRVATAGNVGVGGEKFEASPQNPVARVQVYARTDAGFKLTDRVVARPVDQLRKIEEPKVAKAVSAKVRETLSGKVKEHNEKHGGAASKRVNVGMLSQVFERGIGAYKTNPGSVRPTVTSAEQWAFARVNGFLRAVATGRYRRGKYDTDLLPAGHPLKSEKTEKAASYRPTAGMIAEAEKGLEWRREFGRGGTAVGVARARDIINGNLSGSSVRRMNSFFARHEVDKKAQGFRPGEEGYPSAGRIAWALWGGDAGQAWSRKLTNSMRKDAIVEDQEIGGTYVVKAHDDELGMVFGWANIATKADGTEVVDSHNESILPEDLELAAYDFVLFERASGQDHDGNYGADGQLVESMFFSEEKLRALAIDPHTGIFDEEAFTVMKRTIPTGWWIGFHLPDEEAFQRAKTSHAAFSIEGVAVRESVDELDAKEVTGA